MLKIKSAKKNEKGIALIFTLIMLSLLMILALSFALDSMFEQKAAYNSASSSSSGFMGQAQLKQVLLLLKAGEANYTGGQFYSGHNSDGANDTTNYDQDMLTERLPVDGILEDTDTCFTTADPDKVSWSYIKNADGRIIGRTAFVVIPEDKIPFDSLVSKLLEEQAFAETRIGKNVSEINVYSTGVTGSRGLSDIIKIITPLSWDNFTYGKYSGLWTSFEQMFEAINDNLTTDLTDSEKDEFEKRLSISVDTTEEVFWANISGSGDTQKESGEFYNRFNLARGDWDQTSNADDIKFIKEEILLTQDASTSLDMDMDGWIEGTTSTDGHGLPWLACFGYKSDGTEDSGLAGTFASVKDRRYQIAANLKDYCDSDSYPTSDIDPRGTVTPNWKDSVTHPTYTGNEKTPYIDKIGVYITANTVKEYDTTTAANLTDGWLHSTIEITPCVGLINMYGTSWGEDLVVYVDVDVSFTGKVNTTDVTIPTQNVQLTIDVGSGIWFSGYSNFTWSAGSSSFPTNKIAADPVDSAEMTLTVTDIKINRVVLYDDASGGDADCYDYVKGLNEPTDITLFDKVTEGNSVDYLMGWAVHDARQNLNAGDWKLLDDQYVDVYQPDQVFSFQFSLPVYKGKPNSQNSSYGIGLDTEKPNIEQTTPTGNVDLETGVTDSAEERISTVRIKNAPMDSPWELGFIHRGVRWQTINLKVYDTSKAYQVTEIPASSGKNYILGGGAYSSGDANILDQIKMSSDTETLQKIALDTKNSDPFTIMALLSRIYYECGVDSAVSINSMATGSSPSGTELAYNGTDATTLSSAIKTYYDSSINPEYRLTRASVVSQLLLSTSSTPALTAPTDAQQEELIGKVINLTKISGSDGNFTIIVLAQTIKDIGGDGFDISFTKVSADETTTQTKPDCQIGTFDAVINADSNKSVYFDEISAEQKIMLTGNVSSGKVEITSFQYID